MFKKDKGGGYIENSYRIWKQRIWKIKYSVYQAKSNKIKQRTSQLDTLL